MKARKNMASAYDNGWLYVWGGVDLDGNTLTDEGFRYCAEYDDLETLNSANAPSGRGFLNFKTDKNAVIIDGEFFVWGGYSRRTSDSVTASPNVGGVYSPQSTSGCGPI